MKLIMKYKFFIYITVIALIIINLLLVGVKTFINTEEIAPIFVIYTQRENEDLEKLFTKIQDIETTKDASYMYLDQDNRNYSKMQQYYNLKDIENAFIVMNRKQEVLGIKTPCPDYNFIETIIKKYDY